MDNDPVGVSFRTPNDPNPGLWVNHAVTVDAMPRAGPSGVGGMNCSIDDATAKSYPASGLVVDGDGTHSVSCLAWNRAVGPQGQPNTGGNSMTVHIDESPPALSFQPQNPGDPTALVVDTSDSESGVAGGSIEMAPAGTSDWTPFPRALTARTSSRTSMTLVSAAPTPSGRHLRQRGQLREHHQAVVAAAARSRGFAGQPDKIVNPLQRRVVREQVRVGWHWGTVRRHGKLVRVKRGGHLKTINVVKYVEQCTTKRVQTARHGWQVRRICRAPRVHVTKTLFVRYGHKVTLAGAVHDRVGGAAVRPAGPNPCCARQQLRRVPTGRGRHHRTERELVGDAPARAVKDHPRRDQRDGDDPSFQRSGHRDRPRQGQAAARLAAAQCRGAGPCTSSVSWSAGNSRPTEHSCGSRSGTARHI